MQIIPTVLTFLFLLSFLSYQLVQDFRVTHVESRHYIARYDAERRTRNIRAKNLFYRLKEKTPSQTEKVEVAFYPRKDRKILQTHSLAPLLANTPQPQLVSFYEKLFLHFYSPITLHGHPLSEKVLLSHFSSWIAHAKEYKKNGKTPVWKDLLEGSPLKEKMLEGTHRIDFTTRKGYPPITEVFSFDETPRPIFFSGLPDTALPLFFTKAETALILDKEQEFNKGFPLSMKQLQDLFPSHTLLTYLTCSANTKKELVVSDPQKVIELRDVR